MKPPVKGATSGPNILDLDALQKKAEDILAQLHSLANRDDAQGEIEKMGPAIIELDNDFLVFVTLLAQRARHATILLASPTGPQVVVKQESKKQTEQKLEEQQRS